MKNSLLIEKILKRIDYKSHKLSITLKIEDEVYTDIIFNKDEPSNSDYRWVIISTNYETSLNDLTNRELITLLKSL